MPYAQPSAQAQCVPHSAATLPKSELPAVDQRCALTCAEGFTARGEHRCERDGVFRGGRCEGVPCSRGLTLPHSKTVSQAHSASRSLRRALLTPHVHPGSRYRCVRST